MTAALAIDLTKNKNIPFSQTTGDELVQPNRQLVYEYSEELSSSVDPDKFYDYYELRNWEIAGEPVRDWKALFRSWDRREFRQKPKNNYKVRFGSNPVTDESLAAFMAGSETLLQKLRREENA